MSQIVNDAQLSGMIQRATQGGHDFASSDLESIFRELEAFRSATNQASGHDPHKRGPETYEDYLALLMELDKPNAKPPYAVMAMMCVNIQNLGRAANALAKSASQAKPSGLAPRADG